MFEPIANIRYLEYASGQILYRIHRTIHSPTDFSNRGNRFDDPDPMDEPYLTNYFADTPLGSYAEVFGRIQQLKYLIIKQYSLSVMILKRDVLLAKIDDPYNLGLYGINAEYYSCPNYEKSQRIAKRLYSSREYDGITHPLRFGMDYQLRGQTLFSATSKNTDLIQIEEKDVVSDELIEEANEIFRIRPFQAN